MTGTALKHLAVLHWVLVVARLMLGKSLLWPVLNGDIHQLGPKAIAHVAQGKGVLLLALVFNVDGLGFLAGHSPHLVSLDGGPLDGIEYFNLGNLPPHGISLEQNGFEDCAGGRGRDHIIAHALHLKLRACEASHVAPHFQTIFFIDIFH